MDYGQEPKNIIKSPPGCASCHSTGLLKVVMVIGKHNGHEKTWLWNYHQPQKKWPFFQKNKNFQAYERQLPCSCEKGTWINTRGDSEREWIQPEIRNRVLGCSIKYTQQDVEYYYMNEVCHMLNEHFAGRYHKFRELNEYPPIKDLVQRMTEIQKEYKQS